MDNKNMIEKRSWQEFKDLGFLWMINSILHMFGWAISLEYDDVTGDLKDAYPVRTRFRGFSTERNSKGYLQIAQYMQENGDQLVEEAKE